jgi:ribosomal protein L11 methyltransferase
MVGVVWCWRRRILPAQIAEWLARLDRLGCATPIVTEKPGRVRLLLDVYSPRKAEVQRLQRALGGTVHAVRPSAWMPRAAPARLKIAAGLEITSAPDRRQSAATLHIPHGLAFGSGEHATTRMMLRALAHWPDWPQTALLDAGTGSGILALAARKLGARRIEAFDFDPDAIRTARENERLNFPDAFIRWRRADATSFRVPPRHQLITANLFSTLLIDAAPWLAAALAPGGQLWLSGILRDQADEVARAYRRQKLRLIESTHRGKWVMQRWQSRTGPRP